MQAGKQSVPRTLLFFLAFASVGVSVWFLHSYASLFNSFFLAAMIVMTASPIGFWLRNHGAPHWLATLLSVIVALTATLLIAGVLTVTAFRLLEAVPLMVEGIVDARDGASRILGGLGVSGTDIEGIATFNAIERTASDVVQVLVESVSMFGLVILIVVFMILEAFLLPSKLGNRDRLESLPTDRAVGFAGDVRQYVGITSLLGILGGSIVALILYLLGVPFYAHWGLLYFVLSFVPMIGFWIAVIPPMLVAGQSAGAASALLVLVAYMIVATIINQGIKPSVMRGGLDLSPFWSIASLIVWSAILGPVGLVVGVPLTVALKVLVFEPDDQARWLADLLSAGLPVQDSRSSPPAAAE